MGAGEDQRQHLELSRDIARRFNDLYCKKKSMPGKGRKVFKEPEALIVKEGARVMSLEDGRSKMSKSDPSEGSRINLSDTPDVRTLTRTTSIPRTYLKSTRPFAISSFRLVFGSFFLAKHAGDPQEDQEVQDGCVPRHRVGQPRASRVHQLAEHLQGGLRQEQGGRMLDPSALPHFQASRTLNTSMGDKVAEISFF